MNDGHNITSNRHYSGYDLSTHHYPTMPADSFSSNDSGHHSGGPRSGKYSGPGSASSAQWVAPLRRNVSAPAMTAPDGSRHSSDLIHKYQAKVRDSKRALSRLRLQKDAQLETIKNQLFMLESQLRKEQKEILSKLEQRDGTIASQQQEITKLRRDNRRLMNRLKKFSDDQESQQSTAYNTTSAYSSSDMSDASVYGTINRHVNHSSVANVSSRKLGGSLSNLCLSTTAKDCSHLSLRVKELKTPITPINTSTKSIETVNPNVASVRAMADRILHKPPIAEKPKVCVAGRIPTVNRQQQQTQQQAPSSQSSSSRASRQCTIVSTISRLLEEESDGGAGSSSEPSSPEATLKPTTPRVIRLARQYEGIVGHGRKHGQPNSESSPESLRHQERVIKSLLMDEYEVTSGYNSDAISDHDYENVRLQGTDTLSTNASSARAEGRAEEEEEEGYVEDDDNYVVLQAMNADSHNETSVWEVPENDDQPIYSNIQWAGNSLPAHCPEGAMGPVNPNLQVSVTAKRQQLPVPSKGIGRAKSLDDLLETNIDSPSLRPGSAPTSPDKPINGAKERSDGSRRTMNHPRCRHSINHLVQEPPQANHMADNFEEFTLDSLELDEEGSALENDMRMQMKSGELWAGNHRRGKENLLPSYEMRRCGDGAEMKSDTATSNNNRSISSNFSSSSSSGDLCAACISSPTQGATSSSLLPNHNYEKFLEATGLSQKSILTPTRIFSNHRSVLKPRDIKHRDKLRSTFSTLATLEEAPSPTPPGPSRYWTEPYL